MGDVVIVQNAPSDAPDEHVIAPMQPGLATPYLLEMVFDAGESRAYANTYTDLLGVLVPGYAELGSADDRLAARIDYAVRVQVAMQAGMNASVPPAELFGLPDDVKDVLLASRDTPPVVNEWSLDLPLVLVDVFYSPWTDVPRPVSTIEDVAYPLNLWWLSPAEEEEFLQSLVRYGWVSVNAFGGASA